MNSTARPLLINCVSGKPLELNDLSDPVVMAGVFEQLRQEVWRFAPPPIEDNPYQICLPTNYVLHRLELYFNEQQDEAVISAISEMVDQIFDLKRASELVIFLRN